MSSFIFYKQLSDFTRKYYFLNKNETKHDLVNYPIELSRILSEFGELLLRHDGVAIKVYGENTPLTFLINAFGVKGFEALLEQNSIHFVLWTPLVTFNVDENKGIMPLQSGYLNSKVHCDPEASIEAGLNLLNQNINTKKKRKLINKILKVYRLPDEKTAGESARFGHEGYKSNIFSDLGLPNNKDIMELNIDERNKLCSFASESMEVSVLSALKYSSIDDYNILSINKNIIDRIHKAKQISQYEDKIFELENIPNFHELIRRKLIKIEDIPELRAKDSSVKFRSWIDDLTYHTDIEELAKEYISSITENKSFFDSKHVKIIKSLGIVALSFTIGNSIDGLTGAVIGGAIGGTLGKISEPAIDLGLNLLDSVYLDGLVKGWTPKHYFNKVIKPIIK